MISCPYRWCGARQRAGCPVQTTHGPRCDRVSSDMLTQPQWDPDSSLLLHGFRAVNSGPDRREQWSLEA